MKVQVENLLLYNIKKFAFFFDFTFVEISLISYQGDEEMTDIFKCPKEGKKCCAPKSKINEVRTIHGNDIIPQNVQVTHQPPLKHSNPARFYYCHLQVFQPIYYLKKIKEQEILFRSQSTDSITEIQCRINRKTNGNYHSNSSSE